jgi:hypothetical protein
MTLKRNLFHTAILLAFLQILSGCATQGSSIGAGAAGGGVLGAGVGALADPGPDGSHRVRNVLIGSGVGAVLGAGAGYLIHEGNASSEQTGLEKGKESAKKEFEDHANSSENTPKLIPAKTEAVWIPDIVRGNTFVPGHFEYRIVEGAKWER